MFAMRSGSLQLARMRTLGGVPGGRLMGVDRKQPAATPKGAHDPERTSITVLSDDQGSVRTGSAAGEPER